MKVILKEDVQNLGQQGDVVEVKAGYARNYLMPKRLAILFDKILSAYGAIPRSILVRRITPIKVHHS